MRSLLVRLVAFIALTLAAAPAHAAWHEAKSKHFIIYADVAPDELKRMAERLERFDQAARKLRAMDDPPLTDAERLTIFALEDEDAVGRLLDAPGTLGLYRTGAGGSVAYVPRNRGYSAQRSYITPDNVFFHEYAHHLQLGRGEHALPAWVTEGFAEFFATAEVRSDGSVRIGAPPTYREWSVQRYSGLSIIELLAGSLRGLYSDNLYGRGWVLTHMLTFDPERRGQLQRYIDAIQKGVDPLQAAKSAFGDDLRSVNRDLDKYLRRPTFNTLVVDGKTISPGPVAIRPLRPGEAAIMPVRMELPLDVTKKRAARLASDARKLVAAHPAETAVHVALAGAELEARNYTAAEAAARRAMALDPRNSAAPLILGKARMELGRATPGTTDWNEVRSWFLRANRLEPENAEPLMLFYRSFLYANAAPTPNAVKGLLYAVALAPRDEDLRIDAVRQLVVENRLQEARKLFGPVAYCPHSSLEWRATKTAIMEALAKSDRKTALTLLDEEQKERWTKDDKD